MQANIFAFVDKVLDWSSKHFQFYLLYTLKSINNKVMMPTKYQLADPADIRALLICLGVV